jgi:L-aspartate oxidase
MKDRLPAGLAGCPIVIGGGLAGLMTALRLAPGPVLLLARTPLAEGAASAWAQGGIAAAVGEDDRTALHAADTLAAADGLADPAVAHRIAAAAPAAIAELERHGVVFDRDAAGRLALGLEAAHGRRRIVHVAGDGTGAAIMRALVAAVRATPSIIVIEGLAARRLLVDDRGIAGVLAAGPRDACLLASRRVVLATGGLGGLYAHTTNPLPAIGQGIALAARAGAVLADMEFVQFHPTALDVAFDPMPLVSEAVRGEGAVLVDETGARFMAGRGRGELEPRDVVARAVAAHVAAGHRVFLDARPALGTDFAARFPGIAARCLAAGIDPARQPIPVRPAAHYHMGGVAVDAEGRSTVEGLWACGEVAASGLHGANRLASNSLLEAAVMAGFVAGSIAGTEAASLPTPRPVALPAAPDAGGLRTLIDESLGMVRERQGIEAAIARLEPLAFRGGPQADPALVALMIATGALAREESRGGHWRRDFPQASPAWARRLVQRVHDTGTRIVCRAVPLAIASETASQQSLASGV